MSGAPPVLIVQDGAVARLTINRPLALNAMDSHAHLALSNALTACEGDDTIRVIVLSGAGEKAFSAGRDLKEIAAERGLDPAGRAELAARWSAVRRLTDRQDITKPILARVRGIAFGGGFEIALACDLIIAAEDARFALPEPRRGLIPTAGGVHRLPRQLPMKAAMGLLLTGRELDAAGAHALGLVNAVVPVAELDAEVDRWIADILACAPLSLRAIKQCVAEGLGRPLSAALAAHYPLEAVRQGSDDAREGPRAFAAKRAPVWTGR
ncbi:enoyl-CoA hydratase [Lichenicola cladoniae]|uniref:Enoyl-CoA hydratase n=1 Tax=Lichenicola cladoniae TaxID=1484109 RepID=A0A6M8HPP6_9PROT|nr:enoyl-CoA hydratase-related protein [Lichenicola cladoniae]NPD66553.1 enoyl-CoA hydratase [Acetobacteraceae bacterium]QKE90235.1 enoyl-CoA hydratase [Lichenicola cladoniae]